MIPEGTDGNKPGFLISEISKIEEKLRYFRTFHDLLADTEQRLDLFKDCLKDAESLTEETRKQISGYASELKSTFSDLLKAHRDVHPPISKFGKFIDKNCAEDLSSLTSYFIDRVHKNRPVNCESTKPSDCSVAQVDGDSIRSNEDCLRLIVIEHFLRRGRDSLAIGLVRDFGFTTSDVDLDKFRGLSDLISSIYRGEIDFARKWLSEHKEQLGNQAAELEYTLVKLDFLSVVRQQADDPAAILRCARQLVPFAQTYASDFEHLMGSLVFLGRSLESTPYEDLAFNSPSIEPMNLSFDEPENASKDNCYLTHQFGGVVESKQYQMALHHELPSSDALHAAANLFRTCYCHQLNLSDVDPLFTLFRSGCRLLSRQQNLQRAISCLTKYGSSEGDTLPIAVELDPLTHRHNIFHCPVMKEVVSTSNGPVRLSCGHAISRDAFESLPNSDRRSYGIGQSSSKVKCPYCPIETYKNQVMDLIF